MGFSKLGMIEVLLVFNSTPLLFEISLSRLVACVKKHEQVKEGICSSEARGQFAGIMNRQIYHKWFTVAQNISSKHFYTCFFITTACLGQVCLVKIEELF